MRQTNKQIKQTKHTKNTTEFVLCFVLSIYFWVWNLALRMVCVPSETPSEKTRLSFDSGHQLEIESGLGKWACVHFYSQQPHQAQTPACAMHLATVSVISHMCCSSCV